MELVEQALHFLNSVPFHSTGGANAAYYIQLSMELVEQALHFFELRSVSLHCGSLDGITYLIINNSHLKLMAIKSSLG